MDGFWYCLRAYNFILLSQVVETPSEGKVNEQSRQIACGGN